MWYNGIHITIDFPSFKRDRHGRERMVVGFTITHATSAYNNIAEILLNVALNTIFLTIL